ncbi:MAG: hypothetical protein ACRD3J_27365, partial [Thermoanaerobaculia bacterium]
GSFDRPPPAPTTQPPMRAAAAHRAEGPLPGSSVEYPAMTKAAAFVCSSNRCSRPAFNATELRMLVGKLEQ